MSDFAAEPQSPVAADGAPDVDAGDVEQPWQFTQEQYEELSNAVAFLARQEEARTRDQSQQQGELGPPPDPGLYPDDFAQWLEKRDEQKLSRYDSFIERQESSQGRDLAMDAIHDREQRDGEFLGKSSEENKLAMDSSELAYWLAEDYYAEAVKQYGNTPRAQEHAFDRAAETVRAWEQRIGEQYMARKHNEAVALANAPRPPGPAGGPATQAVGTNGFRDEMDVVRKYTGGFATGR